MLNNPLVKQAQQEYNTCTDTPPQDVTQRVMLIAIRRALIQALGAIEDYLGMERSIEPRRKRIESTRG